MLKPVEAKPRRLLLLANFNPDQPRDDRGRFGSGGGDGQASGEGKPTGLKKLWSNVLEKIGVKTPEPAGPKENPVELQTRDGKLAALSRHTGLAKAQLETLGVKDAWHTNLHLSADLRSHAASKPELFDKQITKVEDSLTQAIHFGGDSKLLGSKLKEIAKLKESVAAFRARHQPEQVTEADIRVLPDHFGKRGAGKINTKAAAEHLAKGHDAKATVQHVMKHGGVEETTAKRYVRAAIKAAASHADANILKLTTEVSNARASRSRKAT